MRRVFGSEERVHGSLMLGDVARLKKRFRYQNFRYLVDQDRLEQIVSSSQEVLEYLLPGAAVGTSH